MSRWISVDDRSPRHGQWVVVPWNGEFKCGQFSDGHPFSPAIVDYRAGKYWNFRYWKPLNFSLEGKK